MRHLQRRNSRATGPRSLRGRLRHWMSCGAISRRGDRRISLSTCLLPPALQYRGGPTIPEKRPSNTVQQEGGRIWDQG